MGRSGLVLSSIGDLLGKVDTFLNGRVELAGSPTVSEESGINSSQGNVLGLLHLLDTISVALRDLVLVRVVL